MGLRNPFRIEYNTVEGELYVADYSPDAQNANPQRGPAGQGKWFTATEPGNYGWPYCATAELPYVDYDFATGQSGATFNCDAPVNESPHNTGLRELPPVIQPQVWYSYLASAEFPELETGGIGPMAGPAYQFDAKAARGSKSTAWPAYYDNVPLFYEWTRDYIKEFRLDGGRDEVVEINDVLGSFDLQNPIDIEFGPNGSLYVLNYGNGFFGQNQPGAELVRIDHIGPGGSGPAIDPRRIALIGFGEVGGHFARGLIASGRHDVSAYDILMDEDTALHDKARACGVDACASAADAARGAAVVISAVTAASARDVAVCRRWLP